jgi:hypothetical protein
MHGTLLGLTIRVDVTSKGGGTGAKVVGGSLRTCYRPCFSIQMLKPRLIRRREERGRDVLIDDCFSESASMRLRAEVIFCLSRDDHA